MSLTWIDYRPEPRTVAITSLMAAAMLGALAWNTPEVRARPSENGSSAEAGAGLAPPPFLLRPLSVQDAEAINRQIPFSQAPRFPAQPFAFHGDSTARTRALECLAAAVYYEASGEPLNGQQAVAQVVLNRVRHPAFPASVCGVVFQGSTLPTGCQFSFTCDGSLRREPSKLEWRRAEQVADEALSGAVYAPVGLSTHYHSEQVVPYWATSLTKDAQVGAHIFYRWPSTAGQPASFSQRYAASENDPFQLRATALISHGLWPSADGQDSAPIQVTLDNDREFGGLLQLLATEPSVAPSAYEKEVRSYFASDSAAADGPAASDTSDADPTVPAGALASGASGQTEHGLVDDDAHDRKALDWLRSAYKPKYASFVRSHRPLYRKLMGQFAAEITQAASDWQTYSAMPLQSRPLAVSLAASLDQAGCGPEAGSGPPALLLMDSSTRSSPAIAFLSSGMAADALVLPGARRERRAMSPELQKQVVAAVFTRIAALSQGADTGQRALRDEVADGNSLVPVLAKRLEYFERHRAQYPTLSLFLPTLVAGLPDKSAGAASGGSGDAAAAHSCPKNSQDAATAQLDQPYRSGVLSAKAEPITLPVGE